MPASMSVRVVSIRALPAEGDLPGSPLKEGFAGFNPRPPCGGRRQHGDRRHPVAGVSIRALPAEGDRRSVRRSSAGSSFNPRPPCGGRREGKRVVTWDPAVSIRALPAEGDWLHARGSVWIEVSIRALPAEGDDWQDDKGGVEVDVSIRALPAEGDSSQRVRESASWCFNPRPPCGGRQESRRCRVAPAQVSIRALPAEGDPSERRQASLPHVSIRALPAEGDLGRQSSKTPMNGFNPRPPCGGRLLLFGVGARGIEFQSAPSLRRATPGQRIHRGLDQGFNPRPPRGGRPGTAARRRPLECFNPRPPCGGRPTSRPATCACTSFQSAPSLRRATGHPAERREVQRVSIRALPAEGDKPQGASRRSSQHVSIRALPAEGDEIGTERLKVSSRFQSAPSLRRATRGQQGDQGPVGVSIRALPAEGDPFEPSGLLCAGDVSIRALPAEGDHRQQRCRRDRSRFNPRPPCGGRP